MAPPAPSVLYERLGDVAVVTLNRPERRNGVTVEMCVALHTQLEDVARSDARVLVLRGAGGDFCVGADLGGGAPPGPPPGLAELGPVYHAATRLHAMPQITIAAIRGGCAGAGMGWACACDLRIAADDARFATAFLAVGVSGDMGLPWTLTRIVGAARARELMLLPQKLPASRALELGLVSRLVPADQLEASVSATAAELCSRDPLALRLIKANLLAADQPDLAQFIELESARHLHTTNRPDTRARMAQARSRLPPGARE